MLSATRAGIAWCALLAACASPLRVAELPLRDPAECQVATAGIQGLDVAVSLDISRSTSLPSGADIDQNGVVGTRFETRTSDPLDSLLAAQVAGVRSLVHALGGSGVRFSIVALSGRSHDPEGTRPMGRIVRWEQARIRAGMTDDGDALERALDGVLETGSEGRTDFAAGMNLAIRTFAQAPPAEGPRRRVVLFLTDNSTPLLAAPIRHPYPYGTSGAVDRYDPLMMQEALRANRAGVSFHTFALGPAGDDEPPHPLKRIAGATGGGFHVVEDAARLHCALLAQLGAIADRAAPSARQE